MERETVVTVLMPAYNAGAYIAEAIDSVLDQTMPHFELLIVNDGSTDDTEAIIHSYIDDRIVVVHQKNSGVANALNAGLRKAKGKYIARFDADDVCFPDRLQTQLDFLEQHQDCVVVGSDAIYISEQGEELCYFHCADHSNEHLKKHLLETCPFTHSSVMYRRDDVLHCGGYNDHAHNMEDHLLWMQLSVQGKFYNIQEPLIKVRFNPSSVTIDEKWRGKKFRELKQRILLRRSITQEEGNALLSIIQKQNTHSIRKGSYYALCGKKFLVNNHKPDKARAYLRKAIHASPLRWDNYALLAASFFPEAFLKWLHQKIN
jgi:glycosyltransferase involved in cell wall biosynthesis